MVETVGGRVETLCAIQRLDDGEVTPRVRIGALDLLWVK
jgi:hypothetical protein